MRASGESWTSSRTRYSNFPVWVLYFDVHKLRGFGKEEGWLGWCLPGWYAFSIEPIAMMWVIECLWRSCKSLAADKAPMGNALWELAGACR